MQEKSKTEKKIEKMRLYEKIRDRMNKMQILWEYIKSGQLIL